MSSEAINSAITGLQADSTWLDVIGNNIANVNTVGYKSSSASFANQFSQALSSGSGDDSAAELGGVDSEEVGGGTRIQSIQTNFTEGDIQQTGVSTDVAIQGNGFIVTKSGANTYLTRAGNLSFDSNGNLVDANGDLVQGYNATLEYTKTTINYFSTGSGVVTPPAAPAHVPAQITTASYVLDTTDTANITNINVDPNMTMPPKATTEMNFYGNLDAAQQANATGGVLDLNPGGQPSLPIGADIDDYIAGGGFPLNTNVLTIAPVGPGFPDYALQQAADFNTTQAPMVDGGIDLNTVKLYQGNYAWEQQPPVSPALQTSETVYDSNGIQRQVTVQFYQVNDLGAGGINNSGPSQAAYAWYAFDTTGGQAVSTNTLLGGTGILQGDLTNGVNKYSYDEGVLGQIEIGDFVYFNTDGSLASGGSGYGVATPNIFNVPGTGGFPSAPNVYLPAYNDFPPASPIPTQGAEITQVTLNFGTFGVLGVGQRNGLTGDAEGSYQVINGINTYVPDSHATVTQNGYGDGTLQSLNVDETGKVVGSFSNGQNLNLAQIAMGTVQNEGGLTSVGNDNYQTSINSGSLQLGLAGSNGVGTITGGALEGSNVNLSTELTNMIIAQKGFDTNARMISTMSSVLQTISQLGE